MFTTFLICFSVKNRRLIGSFTWFLGQVSGLPGPRSVARKFWAPDLGPNQYMDLRVPNQSSPKTAVTGQAPLLGALVPCTGCALWFCFFRVSLPQGCNFLLRRFTLLTVYVTVAPSTLFHLPDFSSFPVHVI